MWPILQFFVILTLFVFIFTQMVLPAFIDRQFFWLFRKAEKELESNYNSLQETRVMYDSVKVKNETEKLKNQISEKGN